MKLSLRAKGILAFAAVVAYVSIVGIVLTRERQKLLELAIGLEQVYVNEGALNRVVLALNHSLLRIETNLHTDGTTASEGDDVAYTLNTDGRLAWHVFTINVRPPRSISLANTAGILAATFGRPHLTPEGLADAGITAAPSLDPAYGYLLLAGKKIDVLHREAQPLFLNP